MDERRLKAWWDCARDESDDDTVTRKEIAAFSDWATERRQLCLNGRAGLLALHCLRPSRSPMDHHHAMPLGKRRVCPVAFDADFAEAS